MLRSAYSETVSKMTPVDLSVPGSAGGRAAYGGTKLQEYKARQRFREFLNLI
jgi:hypothetical protein